MLLRDSEKKSRHIKNNHKVEKKNKYILRGERNARYYDRILSKSGETQQNFFLKKLHWPTF